MKDKQLKKIIATLKNTIKELNHQREELDRKINWKKSLLTEMEYALIVKDSSSSASLPHSTSS